MGFCLGRSSQCKSYLHHDPYHIDNKPQVFALTSLILLTVACQNGIGQHLWLLDIAKDLPIALKYFWAAACIAIFGITFAKIAIIALLLALRAPNQKKRGYFLHFLWITNLALAIVITGLIYTQCTPTKAAWDVLTPGADCSRRPKALNFGYVQGAWAALTDICLAIYPISVVWSLQTTLKMKLGFCLLMSGGLVYVLSSSLPITTNSPTAQLSAPSFAHTTSKP